MVKQKAFLPFLKGFQQPKIVLNLSVCLQCGMVCTNKICRSWQSMVFIRYQQKLSDHVFIDNVYFSRVKIDRWLHLSSSLRGILLENFPLCDMFRKRVDEKNFSHSSKQLNCISSLVVCKLFFDPNSPIFWKTLAEKIKTDDSKVFCFTSKPKILMLKYFKIMFLQFTFDSGIIHLLSQRHSSLLRTTYVILGLQNAQRSY